MSVSLRKISFITMIAGEALGYFALALSPEASRPALVAVPLLAALCLLLGLRLGDRALLATVGLATAACAVVGYFNPIGPVLSAGLLAMHGLLWLSADFSAYRYWRLGIAFLEIILASILSPETHMFVVIFLFAVISSLAMSFGFLERRFGREEHPMIPWHYLGSIFSLTCVLFLSSLLIFPLLPRSGGSGLGSSWVEPGYTETVDFRSTISWASGSSRPMIWIFLPEGRSWMDVVPHGLIRGAVLDIFDGEQWRPGAKQLSQAPPASGEYYKVEIFREPMNSNLLPVPYGAMRLEIEGRERRHYLSGEWPAISQRNRRLNYEVWLGSSGHQDSPKAAHREVPDARLFPEVARLAAAWNRRGMSDPEKIARVLEHFRGFRWNLLPMGGVEAGRPHPVEAFLTETKEGHCELFATAAALLFRRMGMPARLVAGFRAYSDGEVLTARNTDAHAWVEVWISGKGWVPVDPSPVVVQDTGSLFDLYDKLNAYWHRYIVGYEFDGRALLAKAREAALPQALAVFFACWIAWRMLRRLSLSRRGPRYAVTEAWVHIEKRLGEKLSRPEAKSLHGLYLELRFGPRLPAKEDVRRLKRSASELDRSIGAG